MNDLFKKLSIVAPCLSFSCAVHCLLTPILIGVLPILTMSDRTNTLVLMISTVLSLSTLCWGFKKHTRLSPVLILALGFLFLNTNHRHNWHIVASIFGGTCFIISYMLNKRLCKNCHKCKKEDKCLR